MNMMNIIEIENNNSCNCVGECTCGTETIEKETSTIQENTKLNVPFEDLVIVQFVDRLAEVYPFDGSLFVFDESNTDPKFIDKLKHTKPIQFILGLPPKKLEFIFTNKVITKFNERLKIFDEVYSELEEASNLQGSYDGYTHALFMKNRLIINEVMRTLGYRGEFGSDVDELMSDDYDFTPPQSLKPFIN